jgi:hypothetical protein
VLVSLCRCGLAADLWACLICCRRRSESARCGGRPTDGGVGSAKSQHGDVWARCVDAETLLAASVLTCARQVALYRLNQPHGTLQEWIAVTPATPAQTAHALMTVVGSVAARS